MITLISEVLLVRQYQYSAQSISNLIAAIYDCVLAPEKWTEVLEAIRTEFNFQNAALSVTGYQGIMLLGAAVGVDDYWLARILDYGTAPADAWGGVDRLNELPLEEPVVQSRAMPDYDRESNRYFVEWVRPQGIGDAITINLERAANSASNLTMGRHESAGPVTDVELEGLRMLAPHMRRALAISQVLELKTIEAATFVSTLETFNSAILLVDEETAFVHANAAAATMLKAKYPFTLNDNRLVLPQATATEALREAVRNTATGSLTLLSRGAGILVSLDDEAPMVLHVMPLLRSEYDRYAEQRAAAAIFASPAAAPPQMPADALALLYGLTPAETRVFEMLVDGERQSEIALKLGLALSTVKTHLHRVFEKTGYTRQVDLVRLATSLSMPL